MSLCPAAVFAAAEHEGHDTRLTKLITAADTGMDFCGEFYCDTCSKSYRASVSPADVGMPMINIDDDGSFSSVTKDNKLPFHISYSSAAQSFDCWATFKWQGSTSTEFPKKNYSIQLFKDETLEKKNKIALVDDWGKQSKYCLKANWVDFSQGRNIVSGRIFNEIVHSRGIGDEPEALPNGGAVDGYPVLVYINGSFHGLYTLNIPKDKWMFGMDDETQRQALLFADNWKKSPKLLTKIGNVNNVSASGWDLEYCSTEDDPEAGTAWVAERMNAFIDFLNNSRSDFRGGLCDYVDVDRAIDVMLFVYFIYGTDNVAKNIIWATYDGVKWIPFVYDMDGVWGMKWDGSFFSNADTAFTPNESSTTSKINPYGLDYQYNAGGGNMLFLRLLENFKPELTARYTALRETILTKAHLNAMFDAFFAQISPLAYDAEREKWRDAPGNDSNTLHPAQLARAIEQRITCLDRYFGVTINERPEGQSHTLSAAANENGLTLDVSFYNGTQAPFDTNLCAAAYDAETGRLLCVDMQPLSLGWYQAKDCRFSLAAAAERVRWKLFRLDEGFAPQGLYDSGTVSLEVN